MTDETWTFETAIEQIESCDFECVAGPLANNVAWRWLKGRLFRPLWPTDAQFQLGEMVQKKGRASWRGKIVGWYRTELTALGYAVESSFETGSVQIYPETALLPWEGDQ